MSPEGEEEVKEARSLEQSEKPTKEKYYRCPDCQKVLPGTDSVYFSGEYAPEGWTCKECYQKLKAQEEENEDAEEGDFED